MSRHLQARIINRPGAPFRSPRGLLLCQAQVWPSLYPPTTSKNISAFMAEFKYEPSHERSDIWSSKFPVVFWGCEGVEGDIQRIQRFVSEGAMRVAYSLSIDEGRYFRHRDPPQGSKWIDWDTTVVPPHHVSLLWCKTKSTQNSRAA